MINFTLKQLKYFDAVAQEQHFGRAAELCAISQPALSMQIKELEAQLGVKLFERAARQARLTGFGEEFAIKAREILRGAKELEELARRSLSQPFAKLRLGVIPTIAPYLLPRIITRLSDAYPGLDLHVRETLTSKLLEEVEAGRIDAALLALPVSERNFEERPLFEEPFVLVRPKSLEGTPVPDAQGLSQMRLLLLEEGHCFRDQALSFCSMSQLRPRESFDASSLSTLVQMVGAGMGVTLLPEMAIDVEASGANVSIARFASREPSRQIGLVWRKSSPIVSQLEQIATLIGELPDAHVT